MDWMYAGLSSEIDRENFLTGRKVDKNFEQYNEDFKKTPPRIESLSQPASSHRFADAPCKKTLLDLDTVRKEDPLVSIKVQEEQVRRDILENPMKMKCLRKIVMKALRRKMKKMYKGRLTPEERLECARFFHLVDQMACSRSTGMAGSSKTVGNLALENSCNKPEMRKDIRGYEKDERSVSKLSDATRNSSKEFVHSSGGVSDVSKSHRDFQKESRHSTSSSRKRSWASCEKEKRLNEMVQNASWRKEQRNKQLTAFAAHEKDEIQREKSSKGVKNPDSSIGVYAPDAESYIVFKEIFDPIIECYHHFGPNSRQPAFDLGLDRLDQLCTLDPEGKYIQSTRIRCARTLAGYPFNPLLTEAGYLEIENKVKDALNALAEDDLRGTYYPLKGMTTEVQKSLIKDHFLFKEGDRFLQAANACRFWPLGRGIFHNKDKTFLIWVNEEDHLRIISMQTGGNVRAVLDRLIRGLDKLGTLLTFARDDRLGWLSFCPTNLGTTIRASVHIKLPLMSARADFKEICSKMNLQVRGIHGEHSESEGGIHDISNSRRMGITEFEAVKEMYDGVSELIKMEKEMEKNF
ncbi:CWC25 and ATP-gua Ptrans and ATP-gua PtransN doma in containing protein [Trichuris trichiura]|uniref:arginine kinase n=1 Tax=Trichuris trichiura TaxID=36087 RepID=A0A077ZI39_TRITR|nr:CWC25 and ATP-gua Ptrans and ATP-gua PtransN doma in containing protein [Trichuris trichiura]